MKKWCLGLCVCLWAAVGSAATTVAPDNGPFAGGNSVLVTNAASAIGNGSNITNILLGGVSTATITGQGTNWVEFVAPATGSAGAKDVVIQSANAGDTTLAGAYAVNPAGLIGTPALRWQAVGQAVVPGQATAVGAQNTIYGLAMSTNRMLYAGGSFTNIGGSNCYRIARYDGANWSGMGGGVAQFANANCVAASSNGIVYAGGYFTNIGGVNTRAVGKWNGSAWEAMGDYSDPNQKGLFFAPTVNGYVNTICAASNGEVYAGGYFTNTNYRYWLGYVSKWDGAAWTNMQDGFRNVVNCMVEGQDGTIYAGGSFTNWGGAISNQYNVSYVSKWDGTAWTNVGMGLNNRLTCMTVAPDGTLYAGGWFTNAAPNDSGIVSPARYVAKWDAANQVWTNVGSGFNNWVYALATGPDGTLYAGGAFTNTWDSDTYDTNAPLVAAKRIARWDGSRWQPIGDGVNDSVLALTTDPVDGSVYAGGFFKIATQADGAATSTWYVAKWGLDSTGGGSGGGVSPTNGVTTGGFEVVISGGDLSDGTLGDVTGVTICGATATVTAVNGSTQIVVTAGGAIAAGVGDVRVVSTSRGESVASNAFEYIALDPPEMIVSGTNGAAMVSGDPAQAANGTAFSLLKPGQDEAREFSITNGGMALLEISGWGSTDVRFAVEGLPAAVPGGAVSNFTVRFSPDAAGAFEAAIVFSNNTDAATFTLNVSGAAWVVSPASGPMAGGNAVTVVAGGIGAGADIYSAAIGGVEGTITAQTATSVTFTAGADVTSGLEDIVIRSTSAGSTTLTGAYTVHPQGQIGGGEPWDWSAWETVEPMPGKYGYAGAAEFSNKLFSVGGQKDLAVTNDVVSFDGAHWSFETPFPTNIYSSGVAVYNGQLYSVAGRHTATAITNVFRFDGASWTEVAGQPAARRDCLAAVVGNHLYSIGGMDPGGNPSTNVYRYDGATWTQVPGLPEVASRLEGGVLNGVLYIVGGHAARTNVYAYDGTNFVAVAGLPDARYHLAASVLNGALYVYGGYTAGSVNTNTTFRFDGTNWSQEASMPQPKATHAGATYQGQIYAMAGSTTGGRASNVFRYPAGLDTNGVLPSSGSWTGNYSVVISGTNLGNGADITNVTLCGVQATITNQTAQRVWVRVGEAVTPGLGDVVVQSTSHGTTVKNDGFTYTGAGIAASGAVFAPVRAGQARTNVFSVTNSGTELLVISAATNSGAGAGYFNVSGLPAAVAPGTASNFPVVYAPGAVGTHAVTCHVANSSPTPSYSFALLGSCYSASTNAGPFAGGNAVTFTNGDFGTITNVVVGGVAAAIVDSGTSWVTVVMPAVGAAGAVDVVVQTSDNGAVTLAHAYTYNLAGVIGAMVNTAILDNTLNGSASLTNNLGSLTLNNWNAKVISTPEGEPTPLTGMKMSLYSTTTDGPNTVNLGLYQVDASHDPVGSALASTNVELNLTTTAAYHDIPLNAEQWTLQPGTNYALVFKGSTEGITLAWTIAGDGNPYVTTNGFVFLEGRRTTTGGSSWFSSSYNNGLQLLGDIRAGGVSPEQGSWTGDYPVVIAGTNLCDGSLLDVTNVTLGGVAATVTGVSGSTQIVATAGAAAIAGLGDVAVQSTSRGTTVKSNAFEYLRGVQAPLAFAPASPQVYRTTNALAVSGGSGTGAVSYAVTDGPGTIAGDTNLAVTAGSGTITVVATKAQDDLYFAASATATVAAAKADQAIGAFLPTNGSAFVTTDAVGLSASAESGLSVEFMVGSGLGSIAGGTNLTFTGAGTVSVVAGQAGDSNWNAAAPLSNTFTVAKAAATVYLQDLSQTYDGTARTITATTMPAGLTVEFTYDGSATAPTDAGSYAVTGTVNDASYSGSSADTLTVGKAEATVYLGDLAQTYDGTARTITATTMPAGLTVEFTYDGGATAPSNAGTYAVTGTVNEVNYQGSAADTLVIGKAAATVALGSLSQTYDGTPKSATATTVPEGLAVDFTYDGSTTAPTVAGSYAVTGTVNEVNWQGADTGTLAIAKADQVITNFLPPDGAQFVLGSATTVSAQASSGLAVSFTNLTPEVASLVGATITFTNPGVAQVRATQAGDANWNAAAPVVHQWRVGGLITNVASGAANVGGGIDIVIQGVALGDGADITNVTLCGVAATIVTQSVGDVTVTVEPAAAAATGDVTVASATGGFMVLSNAFEYLWLAAPAMRPATDVTLYDLTAHWTGVAGATGYFLEVGLDAGFAAHLPGYEWKNMGAATNGLVDGLLDETDYWIRGYSENASGWSLASPALAVSTPAVAGYDFDADGQADLAAYQTATGIWSLRSFRTGATWSDSRGWSNALPVPADYDGDGVNDVAVYHSASGTWRIQKSTGGSRTETFGWGATVPVPGDYDGDGTTDLAVYHAAAGRWYFRLSGGGADYGISWGWSATVPVPADYDGDGKTDLAVYHPATGDWYVLKSLTQTLMKVQWGWANAVPVPGDYDGDGKADIAVFHRASGNWHIRYSSGIQWQVLKYGWAGTIPVQADYDGDGIADRAIYHPATGNWSIRRSSIGTDTQLQLGGAGQIPVLLCPMIHSWFGLP